MTEPKPSSDYENIVVRRGGKVIGAIFPSCGLRFVAAQVPYFDPDQDGLINGKTWGVRIETADDGVLSDGSRGIQGSETYIRALIERIALGEEKYAEEPRRA